MLDEYGFKRKNYDELISDMQTKSKELYGSDVNTSKSSVLGIIIRVVSWFLSLLYELAEKVYFSGFISQATGVSLDRLGSNSGILRNPASVAMVELTFKGKPNYIISEGVQFSTENKIIFQMIDIVKIDENGIGKGMAISLEMNNESNVAAETIIVQVEPTEELYSVTNLSKAEGGAKAENDKDFRERIRLSVRGNPGPPVNGLLTALLGINGVRTASIVENNTISTDKYGNPPKSIHAYILGGTKTDIANALFSNVAAGIDTVGSETVEVEDIAGFKHVVNFDYAKTVPVYTTVNVTVNEKFSDDFVNLIKNEVLGYINQLAMGESVRYSFIYPRLYQIEGIVVADVKIGKTPTSIKSEDIEINPNESASAITSNVVVNVNEI